MAKATTRAKKTTGTRATVKTAPKKRVAAPTKRVAERSAPAAKPAPAAKSAPVPARQHSPAGPPNHKDIYRRFCDEVLNGGNFEVAIQLLDPVVVSHSPLPGQQPGATEFVAALTAMRKAFPDLHAVATHVVAEGDLVAARLQVTATHAGDFAGIRATGRKIQYEEFVMVRFAGGRIIEHWAIADGLALMQQLEGNASH
jgi:predicted ester cyclase